MRQKFLGGLASLITRVPWLVVLLAVLLTAGSLWLTATRLVTNTNADDLISEKLDYHRQYKEYLRNFGDQEFLYVVVETGNDPSQARAFIDALTKRLSTIPDLRRILGRIDAPQLERSALLHLSTEQLSMLTTLLQSTPLQPETLAAWQGLDQPLNAMATLMSQPGGTALDAQPLAMAAFQFLQTLLDDVRATAEGTLTYRSPWMTLFEAAGAGGLDPQGYITAGGGKFLFLLIMPDKRYDTLEVIAKPLADIRQAIEETKSHFPGVQAGLTGLPVIAADEMAITHRDMVRATILALLAVTLLFILFLRSLTRPLFALLALTAGISWTFGFATLAVGSLNLLSTVFAVVLVGAGFEFGLHLVTRYREELARGRSAAQAITTILTQTARGNITAAITTAAAFYAALLTNFEALRELGLIAGTGILLCLLSMLTLLPALLYLADRRRTTVETALAPLQWLPQLSAYRRTIRVLALVTVVGAITLGLRVDFDHNLLNLQPQGLESVEFNQRITNETETSTLQAVYVLPTLEAVATLTAQVKAAGFTNVESLLDILPTNQVAKIAQLQALSVPDEDLVLATIDDTIHVPDLMSALTRLQFQFTQLADQTLRSGRLMATRELERLEALTDAIRTTLRTGDPRVTQRIGKYQVAFMHDLQQLLSRLLIGLRPEALTIDQLPIVFQQRYVGHDGQFSVYISPNEDIWEPQAMESFLGTLRTINPDVTGVPVEIYESRQVLVSSLVQLTMYALICIVCIVLIDLRSFKMALLALVPLALGLCWLAGIMGLTGLSLNLANFFAIPILIGVGIDNGIQIMHRVRQHDTAGTPVMATSTGLGVLLTSLTTFVSFGMLCFAGHRGIQSLGFVMAIGITGIMFGAIVVLPALIPSTSATQSTTRRKSGT